MKKFLLTILFLALSGLTVYYLGFRKGTTVNRSEKRFALAESKKVDRIVLIQGDNKINLEKTGGKWTVNGKEARTDLVNLLIGVSIGLDAIAPVPKHDIDRVMVQLKNGTKIRIYKKGEILNSYILCKCDNNIIGLRDDYEIPYKITLRSFSNIDLTKIYNTDENYWLTNIFLNIEPEKIKTVSVEYPSNPEMGFILDYSDKMGYQVFRKKGKKELTDIDPEIVSEYLYFFDNIRFYPVDDTVGLRNIFLVPGNNFFNLAIQKQDGQKILVSGYNKPDADTSRIAPLNFYTIDSNNNIISLKFNDFDPILVHADYFLKK